MENSHYIHIADSDTESILTISTRSEHSNFLLEPSSQIPSTNIVMSEMQNEGESQIPIIASEANSEEFPPPKYEITEEDIFNKLVLPDPELKIKDKFVFHWKLNNFASIKNERLTSETFTCAGIKFQLLIMPNSPSMSLYLAPIRDTSDKNDPGNSDIPCQFVLTISNPDEPSNVYHKLDSHRFSKQEPDWGFSNFITYDQLFDTTSTYNQALVNAKGDLIVSCYIRIIDDFTGILWRTNFDEYNSKSFTGFNGIKNQGATCYLNSLLQSYYFTKIFRKVVFQIPSDSNNNPVTMALQKLFYNLQDNDGPVDTSELTRSFGWDAAQSFTQHDVQELNRILMDKLEEKMKGTVVEDSLNHIFVGKMKSFIKCINVDYESSRVEDFWDIQLNVKNVNNLENSFQDYISKEILSGENKYDAGSYGLQDAEKGVIFEEFPNVLHLQLKRFDYDFMYDRMVKINDHFEFPEVINLQKYLDHENPHFDENWEYELFAVLIHAGDVNSGHYYAMIKPSTNSRWYRFEDDIVTVATHTQVFDDNFGIDLSNSNSNTHSARSYTSAYMLVYFRKDKLNEVLCDFDFEKDVPSSIHKIIEEEKKLAIFKREQSIKAQNSMKIKTYGLNGSFFSYQGFDLGVNSNNLGYNTKIYELPGELALLQYNEENKSNLPNDHAFAPVVSIKDKGMKLSEALKQILDDYFEKKEEHKYLRFWVMAYRQNRSIRLDLPIYFDPDSEKLKSPISTPMDCTLEQLLIKYQHKHDASTLYLWLEDTRLELNNIIQSKILLPELPRNFIGINKFYNKYLEEFCSNKEVQDRFDSTKKISINSYADEEITIFLKFFDSRNGTLTGLGHVLVEKSKPVSCLIPILKLFIGENYSYKLVIEEISANEVCPVDLASNFEMAELINGDILVVQIDNLPKFEKLSYFAKESTTEELINFGRQLGVSDETENIDDNEFVKFVLNNRDKLIDNVIDKPISIESFASYFQSRINIVVNATTENDGSQYFQSLSSAPSFQFWATPNIALHSLSSKIGEIIDVDGKFIRLLIRTNNSSKASSLTHIKDVKTIINHLNFSVNSSLILEYEVLNISAQELDEMKSVTVSFMPNSILHTVDQNLIVDRSSTVENIVDKFIELNGADCSIDKSSLIIWIVSNKRIQLSLNLSDPISIVEKKKNPIFYMRHLENDEVNEFRSFFMENSENLSSSNNINADPTDFQIIEVDQWFKSPAKPHGIPFHFVLKKGESFSETKLRLKNFLKLGDKEFSKIQIGLFDGVGFNNVRTFNDDSAVLFDEVCEDDNLFLNHPDRSARHDYGGSGAIIIQ